MENPNGALPVQQPAIERCFNQLGDEIHKLLSKEAQYIDKIEGLSTQLEVFTTAYNATKDKLDMFTQQWNQERNQLESQLRALRGLKQRVTCLIDGDGTIFSPDLIAQGQEGGLAAARKLAEFTRQRLFEPGSDEFQFWVYLFYNKRGLLDTFGRAGLFVAKQKFDEFMMGFNQAAERFVMVDVGGNKEAADAKIKVHLEDNIRLPQTRKIIFGGCHDNGYVNTLRSVITAGFGEKLILLPGYTDVAADIVTLCLPELRIPDLFMSDKLVVPGASSAAPSGLGSSNTAILPTLPSPPPVPPGLGYPSTLAPSSTPRRASIQSYKCAVQTPQLIPARHHTPPLDPSGSSVSSETSEPPLSNPRLSPPMRKPQRRINPKLALSKQTPAPCTLFYLAECRFGSDCKYSHDYLLDEEHYAELRENAKKVPCRATNEGEVCTFGENCVYGHVCPGGTKCFFLKLGRCKFVAAGMHRDVE